MMVMKKRVAVALVDVDSIHVWRNDEIELACASGWSEGYFAWVLSNVRPMKRQLKVRLNVKFIKSLWIYHK